MAVSVSDGLYSRATTGMKKWKLMGLDRVIIQVRVRLRVMILGWVQTGQLRTFQMSRWFGGGNALESAFQRPSSPVRRVTSAVHAVPQPFLEKLVFDGVVVFPCGWD